MMLRIAVVGDRLERGGEILPYTGPALTIGEAVRQLALIGGTADGEACKSAGTIAKAGGPRRIDFMRETAADRDIVLWKCPSPPPAACPHTPPIVTPFIEAMKPSQHRKSE
jgi:hypothetical protein